MENTGPGSRGTGSRGTGSRGVENTGSGGKHGVYVENAGSTWKTRGLSGKRGVLFIWAKYEFSSQ